VILLDTDHLTVISYPADSRYEALRERVTTATTEDDELAASVVSVEEQMRGWLAVLAKARDVRKQIGPYERLSGMIEFFAGWEILPWDAPAADEFERLRRQRVRIGSQDLKIASIAISRGALLLSANLRDFRQVPGLRVESWLS
jgi:tRNA(fMet)-specific endonuclease VapC